MFGLGKPQEHLVVATCNVCGASKDTFYLSELRVHVCLRCIQRALIWAADEAVKASFGDAYARNRYSPPPPAPTRPLMA